MEYVIGDSDRISTIKANGQRLGDIDFMIRKLQAATHMNQAIGAKNNTHISHNLLSQICRIESLESQ